MPAPVPYAPVILISDRKKDREILLSLKKNTHVKVVDALEDQFTELYAVRHPASVINGFTKSDVAAFIEEHMESRDPEVYGVWAWYPWISTLIHFLPEALHTELRTSRNRNLITKAEQDRFYASYIGVAGLSVGNSVVASLVHTGGAKFLRIADADKVSGSNINRVRVGFDMVGMSKSVLVAREAYLVNPYSDISVYEEGITERNIKRFLTHPKPLDIVIDEMDTLYLKIQLRVHARKYGIPVIMAADNGDGIVVDIERYDIHRELPLMHGQVPESELMNITPNTDRVTAAKIISRWVQPENISGRMKDSLLELGKTLYTWPQLGNAAFMAGAVLSYVARKIIVGDPMIEGKVVITPDAYFVPGFTARSAVQERKRKTNAFVKTIGL